MKAMKTMNLKGKLGSLTKRGVSRTAPDNAVTTVADPEDDTPEGNGTRAVRAFCESGAPNSTEGDEVLHLPVIVEAAESAPVAAQQCAILIRKYLSRDNNTRPHVQYNALMLIRILTDNPGPTFTRNMDAKFVATVKQLLRSGGDPGVQQILRETLERFEREKVLTDDNLAGLVDMWKREQLKLLKMYPGGVPPGLQGLPQSRARVLNAPGWDSNSQNYFARNHTSRHLPPPEELSSRIEEAKTSAKLLTQVVQSTPPSEMLQSELIKEFSDRCQSASRSIQKYMHAENPGPDNDTMLILIETNDQLGQAMSHHQRAVLQARKSLGLSAATPPTSGTPSNGDAGPFAPPPGPPPGRPAAPHRTNVAPQSQSDNRSEVSAPSSSSKVDNPCTDPAGPSTMKTHNPPFLNERKGSAPEEDARLGIEPYHPGFNTTPSFAGRQQSAVEGLNMSSAVPERARPHDEDEDEEEEEEEEDRYGAEPTARAKTKAPVYRY